MDSVDILQEAVDWASAKGLLMGVAENTFAHSPFSMEPVNYPKKSFEQVIDIAPAFNTLVDVISRDFEWLHNSLESVCESDEFTRKLLEISKAIHQDPTYNVDEVRLGVHRSDYMLNSTEEQQLEPKQIELNTIASSFGCLSSLTTGLRQYLDKRMGKERLIPDCDAISEIPKAIAAAHQRYGNENASVIFVVQPGERNSMDQRHLEHRLFEEHGVSVKRRSLSQLRECAIIGDNKELLVDGSPISVVYFRAGYCPEDYPSEKEWEARLLIEKSSTIKCPSVDYQLVGTKKVQQLLAAPGVLERFVDDHDTLSKMKECFAGLWAPSSDTKAVEKAIENPARYVLKPQREGGGNNTYGDDIPPMLKSMTTEDMEAYILMERIFPPIQEHTLVRKGKCVTGPCVSEIGIYGVYLGNGKEELLNKPAGHLVRTKLETEDEGGVATGYAVLSSLNLV
eukprot:TRINITY_DN7174_c0_g1_i1.p1 TRINITY_DN7174_c0_g1~~TRINITY_DN7174_c0_g1_i1.p1  ORF type:complete len:453 (-),score=134.24 TRINITY_DN7174_c0_g1_i1:219-1577(-)